MPLLVAPFIRLRASEQVNARRSVAAICYCNKSSWSANNAHVFERTAEAVLVAKLSSDRVERTCVLTERVERVRFSQSGCQSVGESSVCVCVCVWVKTASHRATTITITIEFNLTSKHFDALSSLLLLAPNLSLLLSVNDDAESATGNVRVGVLAREMEMCACDARIARHAFASL